MKRLFRIVLMVGSSRVVPPLVVGFFFLLYIGVAFFTDETLVTLIAFTRKSIVLAAILALIPLNRALCLLRETYMHLELRRMLAGKTGDNGAEYFDEVVELPVSSSFPELENRISAMGYKIRRTENVLAVWRGISSYPVRMLIIAGTLCLFAGVLITTTSRTSNRYMVIEGNPFPTSEGTGSIVERISLSKSTGFILLRSLIMEVASSGSWGGKKSFEIYPPSMFGGAFVYPRYLGFDLRLQFSAPDMPDGYEAHHSLNVYPPGKEDNEVIPGSPYRIVFSTPEPDAGSDRYITYMTGKVPLNFKLMKGNEVVLTGSTPGEGEFVRDGYRLAFPNIRRLVVTDFIRDYGVLCLWAAGLLFAAAAIIWVPIRLLFPRREMMFRYAPDAVWAYSRSEGGARRHAGVFHEALDLIDGSGKQKVEDRMS